MLQRIVMLATLAIVLGKIKSGNYTGNCWGLTTIKMNLEVNKDQIVGSGTNGIPGGAYAVLGEIANTTQVALWAGKAVGAVPAQTQALLGEGAKDELVGVGYNLRAPCELIATGAPNTYAGTCWSLPTISNMVIEIPAGGGWVTAQITKPSPGTCQGYFTPAANQLYIWCKNGLGLSYPADLIYNPTTKTFSGYSYYYKGLAAPLCSLTRAQPF
jgi:hypothetical protein